MADNVVLSGGVRQNLLSLQSIAEMMSTTQNRLATGKKVNSPLDSAVNFFTSAGLESRSGDLGALLDAMSNAIQTVNAANHGITSIVTTIQSMQSTLLQGRQDATWQSTSFTVDTATIGSASAKTLDISGGAVTGTVNIALNTVGTNGTKTSQTFASAYAAPAAAAKALATGGVFSSATAADVVTITYDPTTSSGGSASHTMTVSLTTSEVTAQEAVDKINAAILADPNMNGTIQAQLTAGKVEITSINNTDATLAAADAAGRIFGVAATTTAGSDGLTAFTVNGTAVSLDASTGANLNAAINTANLQLLTAGSAFEAYDTGGNFGIREKVAQAATLTIAGPNASLFAAAVAGTAATGGSVNDVDALVTLINNAGALIGKVKASNDAGKLQIQNLSTTDLVMAGGTGTTIDGNALNTSTTSGNSVRKGLVTQFNVLRDQLDKFSADSSFNGINLLQGDVLKVVFNEQSTSTLNIMATDASGSPFAVNSSNLGINVLQNTDLDANANIDTLLNNLTQSLQLARSTSSGFGSSLSIVQNRQDFTKQMISTLKTGADNLVVADTNEEGANMLALQTRQQLSIAALSLANQANQSVLRLFG
jgi:flagellin-like hook-associated protein FlgL